VELVLSAGTYNHHLHLFSSPLISFYFFPRYALIPQPDQPPSTDRNSGPDSGGGGSRSPPPTSPNGSSRQQPSSSGANRNSGGTGGNTSRGGGGGAGFFQGIINGLSGIAHHGHQSTHTRQHSSSATASETISPTSDSYSRTTPRRSNSDPACHSPQSSSSNSNLGSVPNRTWNNAGTNNGNRRNLPGGWADELD